MLRGFGGTMHRMNSALTILTSVVVSAVVASVFSLFGQAVERRARRREIIFQRAFDLAQDTRGFLMQLTDKTGMTTYILDPVRYAEIYHSLLSSLFDTGKLPDGWKERIKAMMP